MFARFQDIKEGALDGEGAINNVERALGRLTLASGEQMSILDRQTGEFKEFSVVIEQLAGQWDTLSEMEQANIVKAFAGVRQRESFLALMENQAMMHQLLGEEMKSEGLAAERYAIYLEGLEAAQNKATAAWEGMIQATVEGGLVKWFYDASAGLFEFVENLGGLGALLPTVIGFLGAYTVYSIAASGATITLTGTLTALTAAVSALWVAMMANPIGALIALTGILITELIAFKKTSDEMTKDLGDNWADAMAEVASSTQGTGEILKKFEKDIKFLEGISAWEKLWIDESKLLDDGLKNTLKLIEENTSGWREYSEGTKKAVEAAGYLIDEQGKLYTEYFNGNKVVRHYAEGLDTLTYSEMTAGAAAEELAEKIGRVSDAATVGEEPIAELSENFQGFIESTKELGEGDLGISKVVDDFTEINRLFQEGLYTADEYFEQLEEGIASLDMTETFADNDEAALTFFSGLSVNAVEAISTINAEWENGEVSFTTYLENLSGANEMLTNLGEMASDFFGENEAAAEGINLLSAATDELNQRLEVNVVTRETLRQVVEQELEFGTEAYNDAMQKQAEVMAASGIVYTDATGKAMQSANQIYGYLVATDGNMQKLATQTANQTQNTMKNAAVGAAKLLVGLADMIDSFSATISFTPVITGGISLGPLGLTLPTVEMQISGTGVGDLLRSAAGELENWNPEPIDASVYQRGAGGEDWEGASEGAKEYEDRIGSISNALKKLGEAAGKTAKELEKDAKSIDALLDMVIAKIRQEQEARKDALRERLAGFKEVIDKRKELLRAMKDEHDYNNKLKDNQKDLANIQSEMIELRLDDSEEAKARLRQLEEEAARIQKEIDDNAYERSVELQEEALNKRYEKFKKNIEKQIALIDAYLDRPGQIMRDALKMIDKEGSKLYKELIEWNGIYGTGIDNDVTDAWKEAMKALEKYKKGLAELTGNKFAAIIPPPLPEEFSSNALESVPTPEYASSPTPMGENSGSPLSIDKFMDINVAGNLDSSVVPEIEKIVDKAIGKLNDAMRDRGFGQRGASQYSI